MIYAAYAAVYRDLGWRSPLPLPARKKSPVPVGYTGKDGVEPSPSDLSRWTVEQADGNIGVRMPPGMVGLDVDAYGDKAGAEILAALVARYGPLPATYTSGSRDDQESRIRFYRLPRGYEQAKLPGDVKLPDGRSGLEVLQRHHRYAVVFPSIHPEGRVYAWRDPAGNPCGPPSPSDMAELPEAWCLERLTLGHVVRPEAPRAELSDVAKALRGDREDWSRARADATLAGALADLWEMRDEGSGRNNALNEKAYRLGYLVPELFEENAIEESLLGAMKASGYVAVHGQHEALATIRSGLSAGMALEPRPTVRAEAAQPGRPKLKLTKASTIKPRRVKWLWHNRIPLGEITLVAGREGVGKSTYLADLAGQITLGTAKGEYAEPRAVLYVAQEDSWGHTIVPRLLAAGADMDLVYQVGATEDRGLVLPLDCDSLADAALEVNASAIMCDPIISLIDEKLSTDRARELRQALEPLRRAAERSFVSVLGLVHFNKSDGDVLTKIAGSRGWVEVARAAIAIARDEDAKHNVLSQVKNNLGRDDLKNWTYVIREHPIETDEGVALTGKLWWGDHTDIHAEELLKRQLRPSAAKVPEVGVVDFVSAQYAATRRDVPRAAIVGYFGAASAATVDRTIEKCVLDGLIVRVRVGLFAPKFLT